MERNPSEKRQIFARPTQSASLVIPYAPESVFQKAPLRRRPAAVRELHIAGELFIGEWHRGANSGKLSARAEIRGLTYMYRQTIEKQPEYVIQSVSEFAIVKPLKTPTRGSH